MAEETTDTGDELAPNNWFSEYGMPYTTVILKNEAEMYKDNPELAGSDRHPLSQFIIDQETAVAKGYLDGEISESEFNQFKELSAARLEDLENGVEKEMDEMDDDFQDLEDDLEIKIAEFSSEHKAEIDTLVVTAKERELDSKDLSLDLFADLIGIALNNLDTGMETIQPHVHDLVDSVVDDTVESAHAMLDARAEMDGTTDQEIAHAREELGAIEPVFEAEIEEFHEEFDASMERFDTEIEDAKEFFDVAKDHADHNPGISVEHIPYTITDDYDLPDTIDESTGVSDV